MRKVLFSLSVLRSTIVLSAVVAMSSADADIYRPVSVTFVPPLSTNGVQAKDVTSNFSLNIIGGIIGEVDGVEVGSIFNVDMGNLSGFQGSGIINVVGGDVHGLQTAGIINVVGNNVENAQVAGIINVTGMDADGLQAAGIANVVGMDMNGLQAAGIINITGMDQGGAQIAGVVNVGGKLVTGSQIAGTVNIADKFDGAQIAGCVNIAGYGSGAQIGIVNIAKHLEGPAIGLLNLIGNGFRRLNFWASDFSLVNVGLKTGTCNVYGILTTGLSPFDPGRFYFGGGLGGHIPFEPFYWDIDLINYNVRPFDEFGHVDQLFSLRGSAGWRIGERFSVFAGPTLNCWVSDAENGSEVSLYDLPIYDTRSGETWIRVWPGFNVGIQIF